MKQLKAIAACLLFPFCSVAPSAETTNRALPTDRSVAQAFQPAPRATPNPPPCSFSDDFTRDVSGPHAGLQLNWNIFDGNLTRGKVIEARALHDRAVIDLDDNGRRVELEVRTAYSNFIEAKEVLESQKKVQEQAEEALRLAGSRYDAGTGTQLEVLDAQTALTEARTTQIQALHDYSVALACFERAIGEGPTNLTPQR